MSQPKATSTAAIAQAATAAVAAATAQATTAELPAAEIVVIPVNRAAPSMDATTAAAATATAQLASPLVLADEPDGDTLAVRSLLGLDTVEIVHGGNSYHVLADRVSDAISGIDAELKAWVPIPIAVPSVIAPTHQPQIEPGMREVYDALGVQVVDLCLGGAVETTLLECVSTVRKLRLTPGGDHLPEVKNACLHMPHQYACNQLKLKDYYVGPAPYPVEVLASLFGLQYVNVLGRDGAQYAVLNFGAHIGATLKRLAGHL